MLTRVVTRDTPVKALLLIFAAIACYSLKSLLCVVTHLKLDRDLLGFGRVVVTPDDEVLTRDALELLMYLQGF